MEGGVNEEQGDAREKTGDQGGCHGRQEEGFVVIAMKRV